MKLLLIEDNTLLAGDIKKFLSGAGFVVEHAATFVEASEKIALYQYDLTIVDLGLPDGDGLNLVQEVKDHQPETGILILTANDGLEDKVRGLRLGADDYMTKPFHTAELNARIHSILRRGKFTRNDTLQIDALKIDLPGSQAFVDATPLNLTKKEFDLLLFFMRNPDRVLTKESIAEYLWGDHMDQSDNFDFIYNHIKNLRKKIVNAGGKNFIQAMYGMGYKFKANQ